jgi:hypothetical protein
MAPFGVAAVQVVLPHRRSPLARRPSRVPAAVVVASFAGGLRQDQVMRVSVLYFEECPNWREAGQRLRHALSEIGHAATEVSFVAVETEADAAAQGFQGSPTFTVDGEDLFPGGAGGALTCRVYATAGGLAGLPEVTDLVTALRAKRNR